jgi:carbonic anhydrase
VFGTGQVVNPLAAYLAGQGIAVRPVSRHRPPALADVSQGTCPGVHVLNVRHQRDGDRHTGGTRRAQTEGETVMSLIDEALSANATIANGYDPGRGKPPAPKIAIVTCADPRLSDIEQMLGLAEGDVDMIRNFGTVIDDDAVRSLVLSTRLLGTREIMIINHTDCGMLRFTDSEMEDRLRKETGQAPIAPAKFYSFTDAEANTKEQIQKARSHPWISPEVPVRGFVYDVSTGRLSEVFPGGETVAG